MSAVAAGGAVVARVEPRRGRQGLEPAARRYLALVLAAAAAATVPLVPRLDADGSGWTAFAVLAAAAAAAQLFVVVVPPNQAYYTAIVFLVAAALLLPPELVALIALVQHVPEWLKYRYPWYIQTFNIANYTLNLLAAWGTARLVGHAAGAVGASGDLRLALGGIAAAATFVGLNHLLLAVMLRLARVNSLRETGLFSLSSVSTDFVLALLGVVLAAVWLANPWLTPLAVAPLFLIHRSLAVPQLQAEARIEPKTGLFNAGHFAATLDEELGRAARFERPLSVLMADLDLLREINNRHGHLAGDAVLRGIAEIFRGHLRRFDLAARFGGEEFAILLPETTAREALEIAERIRRDVAATAYDVETAPQPVHASVSIGVAAFPLDGQDATSLLHQADLAVYRAKLQGRNRALLANPELVEQAH